MKPSSDPSKTPPIGRTQCVHTDTHVYVERNRGLVPAKARDGSPLVIYVTSPDLECLDELFKLEIEAHGIHEPVLFITHEIPIGSSGSCKNPPMASGGLTA